MLGAPSRITADYQSQTAIYRASEREVRLHECRSACTMALGLYTTPAIIKPTLRSRDNY